MPGDIREYLLDRFRADASTLRQRAASLQGVGKPSAGPNAVLSTAMANACDNVVALAEQLPENASVGVIIEALKMMVPKLTQLANSAEAVASPAIRSVYVGACTRAQELIAAETSAANTNVGQPIGSPSDLDDDVLLDDDFEDDDEDVDDDDLYDDSKDEDNPS